MVYMYLVIIIFAFSLYGTDLSSQENKVDSSSLRIISSTSNTVKATGTAIYLEHNENYYILTAYHNIYQTNHIRLCSNSYTDCQLEDIIDGKKALVLCDPTNDLAIFKCNKEKVINKLSNNCRAVKILKGEHKGCDVKVVGNPDINVTITIDKKEYTNEHTSFNYVVGATISEYEKLEIVLPPESAKGELKNARLLILQTSQITHGFSGGPVLYKKDNEYTLLGMLQGGTPKNLTRSWAIPSDSIAKAIEIDHFADYPLKEWPESLIVENVAYSKSSKSKCSFQILSVSPRQETPEGSFISLMEDKEIDVALNIRISNSFFQKLLPVISADRLEVIKDPSPQEIKNNNDLIKFEWKLRPLATGIWTIKINFHSEDDQNLLEENFKAFVDSPLDKLQKIITGLSSSDTSERIINVKLLLSIPNLQEKAIKKNELIPILINALSDDQLQGYSEQALAQIGKQTVLPLIYKLNDKNSSVITSCLTKIGPQVVPVLLEIIPQLPTNSIIRNCIIETVAEIGTEAIDLFIAKLKNNTPLNTSILELLCESKIACKIEPENISLFLDILKQSKTNQDKIALLLIFARMKQNAILAIPELLSILETEENSISERASQALQNICPNINDISTTQMILDKLEKISKQKRYLMQQILNSINPESVPTLISYIQNTKYTDTDNAKDVLNALKFIVPKSYSQSISIIPPLGNFLVEDRLKNVRKEVIEVLENIFLRQGQNLIPKSTEYSCFCNAILPIIPTLIQILQNNTEREIRETALRSLQYIVFMLKKDVQYAPKIDSISTTFYQILENDKDVNIRSYTIRGIGNYVGVDFFPIEYQLILIRILQNDSEKSNQLKQSAIFMLGRIKAVNAVPVLIKILKENQNIDVLREVLMALKEIGSKASAAKNDIIPILTHTDLSIHARLALESIGVNQNDVNEIFPLLMEEDLSDNIKASIVAIINDACEDTIPAIPGSIQSTLVDLLKDTTANWNLRSEIVIILSKINSEDIILSFIDILQEQKTDYRLKKVVVITIGKTISKTKIEFKKKVLKFLFELQENNSLHPEVKEEIYNMKERVKEEEKNREEKAKEIIDQAKKLYDQGKILEAYRKHVQIHTQYGNTKIANVAKLQKETIEKDLNNEVEKLKSLGKQKELESKLDQVKEILPNKVEELRKWLQARKADNYYQDYLDAKHIYTENLLPILEKPNLEKPELTLNPKLTLTKIDEMIDKICVKLECSQGIPDSHKDKAKELLYILMASVENYYKNYFAKKKDIMDEANKLKVKIQKSINRIK